MAKSRLKNQDPNKRHMPCSFSLPIELRHRMDRHESVNWSRQVEKLLVEFLDGLESEKQNMEGAK